MQLPIMTIFQLRWGKTDGTGATRRRCFGLVDPYVPFVLRPPQAFREVCRANCPCLPASRPASLLAMQLPNLPVALGQNRRHQRNQTTVFWVSRPPRLMKWRPPHFLLGVMPRQLPFLSCLAAIAIIYNDHLPVAWGKTDGTSATRRRCSGLAVYIYDAYYI